MFDVHVSLHVYSNASIAYFCFFFACFSDLGILYFRKCVVRPLPYNSENMDCWKSLPMVRKELMLDCWIIAERLRMIIGFRKYKIFALYW